MAIRIECDWNGEIIVSRYVDGRQVHYSKHNNLEAAVRVIRLHTKEDFELAKKEAFESQSTREAKKELAKLLENPYGENHT